MAGFLLSVQLAFTNTFSQNARCGLGKHLAKILGVVLEKILSQNTCCGYEKPFIHTTRCGSVNI